MNQVPPRTRQAWLKRITAALQIAVPQFESSDVVIDSAGRPHLDGRYTNWRRSGAKQNEGDFSDGTLRLIGLLWSLVEVGRRKAPILMEEPELSLHPAVVGVLPQVLAKAQGRTGAQMLITTHSTDLLADESVLLDEVLELVSTANGTIGRLLATVPEAAADVSAGIPLADVARARSGPPRIDRLVSVNLAAG